MKNILVAVLMSLVVASNLDANTSYGGRGGYEVFYSSLSPYGEWIEADIGYVWRPTHVWSGWRPYLHGHWVWTDYGWYWVSREPFGWATFHYGRWYYDDFYGWVWVPDNVWGPSWVEWRYDDDYIGWAPLSPYAQFDIHIGISFTHTWIAPVHYWNFVPCRHFTTTRIVDYVQPIERSRRIFGNTRSVAAIESNGDRVVNRGVDVGFIERRTNTRVKKVEVVTTDRLRDERVVRDGNRDRVEVFRPRVEGSGRDAAVAPPNVRRSDRPLRIEGRVPQRNERGDPSDHGRTNDASRIRKDTRESAPPINREPPLDQSRMREENKPRGREMQRDTRREMNRSNSEQSQHRQLPEMRRVPDRPPREIQMRQFPREERRQDKSQEQRGGDQRGQSRSRRP